MNDPVVAALRGIAIIFGVGSAIALPLALWLRWDERRNQRKREEKPQ
jgi:hypothetical protein